MDESDIYVRDHLLIQFIWMMQDTYKRMPVDIEDIYQDWIKWLKAGEEVANGKRSEI